MVSPYNKIDTEINLHRYCESLPEERLTNCINNTYRLHEIFKYTDPNIKVSIITTKISITIETLVPNKLVKCYNKYNIWLNNNFRHDINIRNNLDKKITGTKLKDYA